MGAFRIIGLVVLDMGRRRNELILPLAYRFNNNKQEYRALYGNRLLPVITNQSRLYTNDIVSVKLNSWFGSYATGKVRI